MDAIIVAGGTGSRLAALAKKKHKGALRLDGRPLIARVMDMMLVVCEIKTVWVLTGHRAQDLHDVLGQTYTAELQRGQVRIVDAPHIVGPLSRVAYGLRTVAIDMSEGCIVAGIDSVVPSTAIRKLVLHGKAHRELCLLGSPHCGIAISHPTFHLRGNAVCDYANEPSRALEGGWFVDVGPRYFAPTHLQEVAELDVS